MPKMINLDAGQEAYLSGVRSRIVAALDPSQIVVENVVSGVRQIVSALELSGTSSEDLAPCSRIPLASIPDSRWQMAEQRLEAIRPLLNLPERTAAIVKARSLEMGKGYGYVTLYKWIRIYEETEVLSSLAPRDRPGGRGKGRINAQLESIIFKSIKSIYLTKQRMTVQSVHEEVRRRCEKEQIPSPGLSTVRNRIMKLNPELVAGRRLGSKAKAKFNPLEGSLPGVDHPLSVVQIDHTPLDVVVVDEQFRQPIRRPWITVAIDVFSRMIIGYYISLDPPGDNSVGLCLVQAILPKEMWLHQHQIEGEWPCFGFMKVIHCDNAREFHGKMLRRACKEYDIDLKFRPVARPNYGAHIERLLGTALMYTHTIPGTTFSNVAEKGEYDSSKEACLTLFELEKVMARWIIEIYNPGFHRGILTSPIAKFRAGLLACGQIKVASDPRRLMLDFTPSVERTVQPYGVVVEQIYYWHDILRPWINAPDPKNRRRKRSFLFKTPKRDISKIYFLDPDSNEYHEIPYRDIRRPSMSVWEHRAARRRLAAEGRKNIDEHSIFEAHRRNREDIKKAASKTRSARREEARHDANATSLFPKLVESVLAKKSESDALSLYDEPIIPFGYEGDDQ
jgi:putative transposase